MSNFASQAPRPAILINSTACSMSWYLRENSSRGIKLLMLGIVELWGEDKSIISRFFAGKFSCGYADGADAEDFEGGFVERADHEACFDFFRYEIIYGVGLGVGGLEIVTGVVLGKRAFDAGVETLTEAEQKVFAELSIRVVGEFGGQTRNVHRSR